MTLLEVRNLSTYFYTKDGVVKAVDGASFELERKQVLGIVGETGCGKSVTALSILRLLPPHAKIEGGEIILDNEKLLEKTEEEMRKIRGKRISMVFQHPTMTLNPAFTIGDQISTVIKFHSGIEKDEAIAKAVDLLRMVGIADPKDAINKYPHELSVGMKQRALIAIALSCNPDILICDEPTSALDVTIQIKILQLLKDLRDRLRTAIIFITHDFGIVNEICERVAVMYAGEIVELGDKDELYNSPKHPYTKALINIVIKIEKASKDVAVIPGAVANPINPPSGCKFHPRCQFAADICSKVRPESILIGSNHYVKCLLYTDIHPHTKMGK